MGWLRRNLEMLLHWSRAVDYEDEYSEQQYADDAYRKGESPCLIGLEKKTVIVSNSQTTPLFLAECLHDLAVSAAPATVGVWGTADHAYNCESFDTKTPNTVYLYALHNALGDIVRVHTPVMQKRGTHKEAIAFLHLLARRDFAGIGRYKSVDHAHHDAPTCDLRFEETLDLKEILNNQDFTPKNIHFRIILQRWNCSGNPRGTLAWNEKTNTAGYRIALEPRNITPQNTAALYALARNMLDDRGYSLGDNTHPQFKQQLMPGRF